MNSTTIRVGIVGAGGNTTARHIPGLQAIDGVKIISVCNRTRASSERVSRQWGIPTIYDDWQALVAAPDTDAIVIGTWPYLHGAVTLAALDAHKHVLCEARMAMSAGEARAMCDAARAHPRQVAQVVPSPTTLRVDATIQQLIGDGYLGDILAVTIRDGNNFVDPDAPLHWRQDTALSGVNIMSLGIWYEAMMRWVGPATRVTAVGQTFTKMRRNGAGLMQAVRVPEHVDVVAELACGGQAHIQISAVTGLAGPAEATIFGSKGTLRWTQDRLYGARRDASVLEEIAIPENQAGGWRVEEEWVNAIRGVEPVRLTTFEDGVQYMEFTEAVARGIATGGTITLPF